MILKNQNGFLSFAPIIILATWVIFFNGCKKVKEENKVKPLYTSAGTVTDVEGNSYNAIEIGTQTWMAANLKTTKYSNGDPISTIYEDSLWTNSVTGAYCYYENKSYLGSKYGCLYNWYAVNDARGLCPTGWHVPHDSQWGALIQFLGGYSVAGYKLKETGLSYGYGSNISGFTALPGGWRDNWGGFDNINNWGFWWSSSMYDGLNASGLQLDWFFSTAYLNNSFIYKTHGLSVRCLKN
jgi:uncharacterized protein (TIGR02145 family)